MSNCARCGATFSCAMADAVPATTPAAPCWCTYLPLAVPVPVAAGDAAATAAAAVGCWCPACLAAHIAARQAAPAPAS